jgi:hypothetical protein
MPNQQTTGDGYQVPPGMMLVPAPQQQPETYANVSQHKHHTLNHNPSFKMNKIAPPPPPPPVYNTQTVNHSLPNNCNII